MAVSIATLQAYGDSLFGGLETALARRPTLLAIVKKFQAAFDADVGKIAALVPPTLDLSSPVAVVDFIFSYLEGLAPFWAVPELEIIRGLIDSYLATAPVLPTFQKE